MERDIKKFIGTVNEKIPDKLKMKKGVLAFLTEISEKDLQDIIEAIIKKYNRVKIKESIIKILTHTPQKDISIPILAITYALTEKIDSDPTVGKAICKNTKENKELYWGLWNYLKKHYTREEGLKFADELFGSSDEDLKLIGKNLRYDIGPEDKQGMTLKELRDR